MRRTLTLLFSLSMVAAACGASDDAAPTSDLPVTSEPAATDIVEDPIATDDAPATDAPDATDAPVDDGGEGTEPTTTFEDVGPPPTSPDKPTDIAFPGSAPDKLVVTVLSPGTGPESEAGDTVIVDYIGVRSLDGVEFDNSYDRFEPFPVGPLGEAGVIQGWNDGLIGVQAGAQVQLDIPSDLAYGEAERSEVIRENEPLTFVIDVRSVIKIADPADEPEEAGVAFSEGIADVATEDLTVGDGAVLETGQTAVFHLVLFRGDNGARLDSTWESEPIQIPIADGGFVGLVEGMPGMAVGGRRAITVPPDKGFGAEGNPPIGLPAGADIILVIDLLGVY